MRIGHHGTTLELGLSGYQFPALQSGLEPLDDRDWDANWLIVTGEARAAEGSSWRFRDPALTTWEVAELVTWLRAVIAQTAPAGWLEFTEPHLRFVVGAYRDSQVTLLVELGHEAAEPPLVKKQAKQSLLTIETDQPQLEQAVAALERQLAEFPPR